jgi:hypothetical protein
MTITHSGNGVTSGSIIDGPVFNRLMIRATADAVVTINGYSVNIDVDDAWVTIDGNGNSFAVTSGTVNYIVFG